MADYDYNISDPSFIEDLRKSQEAVRVATQWLSAKGYPVIVRPTFERPDTDAIAEFSDHGDLEIVQRVEVKRRVGLDFTSKDDFPYSTLIVDACHCFDKAHPKPYAYIIFNKDMSAAFVVNTKETMKEWKTTRRHDAKKARDRSFYECPVSLLSVVQIEG